MVSKLVDKHQMTFIKGELTVDATLIASECVYSRMRGVAPGVINVQT